MFFCNRYFPYTNSKSCDGHVKSFKTSKIVSGRIYKFYVQCSFAICKRQANIKKLAVLSCKLVKVREVIGKLMTSPPTPPHLVPWHESFTFSCLSPSLSVVLVQPALSQ